MFINCYSTFQSDNKLVHETDVYDLFESLLYFSPLFGFRLLDLEIKQRMLVFQIFHKLAVVLHMHALIVSEHYMPESKNVRANALVGFREQSLAL